MQGSEHRGCMLPLQGCVFLAKSGSLQIPRDTLYSFVCVSGEVWL